MNLLQKPKENKQFAKISRVVDFPDEQTAKIFDHKWQCVAYIMGVSFKQVPVPYGENCIRYEFEAEGFKEQVKEFKKFVDNSLELVVDKDNWPDVFSDYNKNKNSKE